MATTPTKAPFDHEALKASLRSAKLHERANAEGPNAGMAYSIRLAHAQDDVLEAIGAFRQRFNRTPAWFEWRCPQMLILGPLP